MRNLLFAATAATALALASPASAGLIADYSIDGGANFVNICSVASGSSCGATLTVGGIELTLFGASSNSPGDAIDANVFQSTVQARNTSGLVQSIILRVGDIGYTNPVGNVNLLNNIAGTVTLGSPANLFSSTACVNPTNAQSSCVGAGTISTPVIVANITSPGTGDNSATALVAGLTGPYSLTQFLDITLGAGSQVNFSASADIIPLAAPEPASLAIIGVGMAALGMIRRRKRNA